MPQCAHLGDEISHGGNIVSGSPDMTADGIPVARIGDAVECHIHGPQSVATGSAILKDDGNPVARFGDLITCGAFIGAFSVLNIEA